MKLSSITLGAIISTVVAEDVVCYVDNTPIATVDETGICPFPIPDSCPAPSWSFNGPDDYNTRFYYTDVNGQRYYTDITQGGKIINIPAGALIGNDGVPPLYVDASQNSNSNSTSALRRRLMGVYRMIPRDVSDDIAAGLKNLDGKACGNHIFRAVPADETSTLSSVSISSETSYTVSSFTSTDSAGNEIVIPTTVPVDNTDDAVITTTSCSNGVCSTVEISGTVSSYTTTDSAGNTIVVPTTVPVDGGAVITTTSCSNGVCSTVEISGTVSSYTTTDSAGNTIVVPTTVPVDKTEVTSCNQTRCVKTVVGVATSVVTEVVNGEETVYTTVCPETEFPLPTSVHTKTITVIHCNDNGCYNKPSITSDTLVGKPTPITQDGVVTDVLTWCPIESGSGNGNGNGAGNGAGNGNWTSPNNSSNPNGGNGAGAGSTVTLTTTVQTTKTIDFNNAAGSAGASLMAMVFACVAWLS